MNLLKVMAFALLMALAFSPACGDDGDSGSGDGDADSDSDGDSDSDSDSDADSHSELFEDYDCESGAEGSCDAFVCGFQDSFDGLSDCAEMQDYCDAVSDCTVTEVECLTAACPPGAMEADSPGTTGCLSDMVDCVAAIES